MREILSEGFDVGAAELANAVLRLYYRNEQLKELLKDKELEITNLRSVIDSRDTGINFNRHVG